MNKNSNQQVDKTPKPESKDHTATVGSAADKAAPTAEKAASTAGEAKKS